MSPWPFITNPYPGWDPAMRSRPWPSYGGRNVWSPTLAGAMISNLAPLQVGYPNFTNTPPASWWPFQLRAAPRRLRRSLSTSNLNLPLPLFQCPRDSAYYDDLLARYLPRLEEEMSRSGDSEVEVAARFARRSKELEGKSGWLDLRLQQLHSMYDSVLEAIDSYDSIPEISRELENLLEERLEVEALMAHGSPSNRNTIALSLVNFGALCEISRQTKSRPLAAMLCEFFCTHAPELLTAVDVHAVAKLAWATFVSYMTRERKEYCYLWFNFVCPKLVDHLYRSDESDAKLLADELAAVEGNLARWHGRRRCHSKRRQRLLDDRLRSSSHSTSSSPSPRRSTQKLPWHSDRKISRSKSDSDLINKQLNLMKRQLDTRHRARV